VAGSTFSVKTKAAIIIAVKTFPITHERATPNFLKSQGDALCFVGGVDGENYGQYDIT
jgi:hypothetical protein